MKLPFTYSTVQNQHIRLPALQVILFSLTRYLFTVYQFVPRCATGSFNPLQRGTNPATLTIFVASLLSLPTHISKIVCPQCSVNKFTVPRQIIFSFMFVPRNSTKPIFYAYPSALQMFFDKIIPSRRIKICKAVLLLPALLNICMTFMFSAVYKGSSFILFLLDETTSVSLSGFLN